jgi:hypothetical protein
MPQVPGPERALDAATGPDRWTEPIAESAAPPPGPAPSLEPDPQPEPRPEAPAPTPVIESAGEPRETPAGPPAPALDEAPEASLAAPGDAVEEAATPGLDEDHPNPGTA